MLFTLASLLLAQAAAPSPSPVPAPLPSPPAVIFLRPLKVAPAKAAAMPLDARPVCAGRVVNVPPPGPDPAMVFSIDAPLDPKIERASLCRPPVTEPVPKADTAEKKK